MWIFKNDAFVSIVQDKDMDDQLWVRARIRGDLERFFKDEHIEVAVIETPNADYRFRVCVDRGTVSNALETAVDGIDYVNFKNSIGNSFVEDERHNTYLRVWASMMNFQRWALGREDTLAARNKGKKKGAQS